MTKYAIFCIPHHQSTVMVNDKMEVELWLQASSYTLLGHEHFSQT
jgi:hypothetical protein